MDSIHFIPRTNERKLRICSNNTRMSLAIDTFKNDESEVEFEIFYLILQILSDAVASVIKKITGYDVDLDLSKSLENGVV